jgi:outer membrane receptor protein involved in Fe transport
MKLINKIVMPGFMPLIKLILFILILAIVGTDSFAQSKGSVSGKVIDKSNNESLIGANVILLGTNFGSSTDLDGVFSIKAVPSGTYDLKVSFVSYNPVTIQNVIVGDGKETIINVTLEPTSTNLAEVVITADMIKSSEGAVLNIQKNSLNIVDGLSAELISKNNSSDGTDVLKRMTGVTITDGKYAFVRGVGDRYNNTMLNGSNLPSTDPEKKSFSYDLFPASLIENILTSKTFTPDKPADFTGGLVEINTIEFPSKFIFDFSASTAYNTTTTNKEFFGYAGGAKDWLGFDDGTRSLPSLIPDRRLDRTSFTKDELQSIGRSFANNWNTKTSKAPVGGSLKINLGNKHEFGENVFGYIASLSYSNSDEIKQLERNNYADDGPRYLFNGANYNNSVSWGALLNTSLKIGSNNKISFKNIYNQSADSETILFEGDYLLSPDYRKVSSLRYVSRSLSSSQLIGEHHLKLFSGVSFDWNLNYARSRREEPDARRYVYVGDPEYDTPFMFLLDQAVSTRFFSDLVDFNRGASFNIKLQLFDNPSLPTFKFGFAHDYKNRDFDARVFGFLNIPGGNFSEEQKTLFKPIEEIFDPSNINHQFIEITEITKPSDSYLSNQAVTAAYFMTDFELISKLKFVIGARYERSELNLISQTLTGESVEVKPRYNDLLPSLNVTWQINETMNLRGAFTKTLARPEFRELAPFTYFDFLLYELVEGNTNLQRALINNYDLRYEIYPAPGELLAVSVFYKRFLNPIEQVLVASAGFAPFRTFANADKANNYGVEFELRKNLGFISSALKNLSFVGNLSLINSSIDLGGSSNGFQVRERAMQGQADYISNLGLYYENFESGTSASIIHNRVGERISRVGFANLGDIVELPRDQVDLSFSQNIMDLFSIKVAFKDILAQDHKFIQRTTEGDKIAERYKRGRTISFGLSYKI